MSGFTYWQRAENVFPDVRNIFCVGRNYRDHAAELGNQVPTSPMIFGKFTHALTAARDTVPFPVGRAEIHHELEIVLWIDHAIANGERPEQAIGAIALGLDLTDRALQSQLKTQGHPWEAAKSFRHSAIVSDFYSFSSFSDVTDSTFAMTVNGRQVQIGQPQDMVFSFAALIRHCAQTYGLNRGDLIFTGTLKQASGRFRQATRWC
ncbi:fumarylacetoacetate hydrolase [Alicyclobacillus sacchari]|uniref:fumarylacetoacetate hydrolase family protein n=1 Tax=Alicyclobacillus sacchari TaxID=392010 RepID=UPI0023E9EEBA|nr:fumarylacetoacetate hydrolase family protein [Alicyclobacillus sacchari]GMA56247.1 fumarylacetoacetate hydrolase [Alicyclobacillus sacchari]